MKTDRRLPVLRVPLADRIIELRGSKVLLDADLAELYGVPTKALNQAVRRNKRKFPSDFMIQLTAQERDEGGHKL